MSVSETRAFSSSTGGEAGEPGWAQNITNGLKNGTDSYPIYSKLTSGTGSITLAEAALVVTVLRAAMGIARALRAATAARSGVACDIRRARENMVWDVS
jgi:hypothetical protein